ncbi:pilin [Kingella kingae]|nr:pilin [Kingella kingae]
MEGAGNDAGSVKWTCTGGSLDTKFRPSECRGILPLPQLA